MSPSLCPRPCYWVAAVVDHFSRRVMGTAAFRSQPTSEAVRGFLGRTIAKAKTHAQVHRLRPRWPIRLRWLPCVVPTQRHQATALRGHRPARLDRRGRAIHLDDEVPALLPSARAVTTRGVSARASRPSSSGTTAIARTLGSADGRPTRCTTGRIPPTVARDLNLAAAGLAVRRVPDRRRWCGASPAHGSTWK